LPTLAAAETISAAVFNFAKPRRGDFQGDGEQFFCFVAARRQTAAIFSFHFQITTLCQDAATPSPVWIVEEASNCFPSPCARLKAAVNAPHC
jgi:hypothetical protein